MNPFKKSANVEEARMLAEELVKIAREASVIIMRIYIRSSFDATLKDDKTPLTIADTQASDCICKRLYELDQNIPIICEETKLQSYDERKKFKKFWLVDPLDGTKEFIKRNGEFTVNIALIELQGSGDYIPIMGVISVPAKGTVYVAERGFERGNTTLFRTLGNSWNALRSMLMNQLQSCAVGVI